MPYRSIFKFQAAVVCYVHDCACLLLFLKAELQGTMYLMYLMVWFLCATFFEMTQDPWGTGTATGRLHPPGMPQLPTTLS